MKSISQNVVIFLINLAIFCSILLVFFSYNLHYFYLHGAPVYDSGWVRLALPLRRRLAHAQTRR